jgi:hypothetical protein
VTLADPPGHVAAAIVLKGHRAAQRVGDRGDPAGGVVMVVDALTERVDGCHDAACHEEVGRHGASRVGHHRARVSARRTVVIEAPQTAIRLLLLDDAPCGVVLVFQIRDVTRIGEARDAAGGIVAVPEPPAGGVGDGCEAPCIVVAVPDRPAERIADAHEARRCRVGAIEQRRHEVQCSSGRLDDARGRTEQIAIDAQDVAVSIALFDQQPQPAQLGAMSTYPPAVAESPRAAILEHEPVPAAVGVKHGTGKVRQRAVREAVAAGPREGHARVARHHEHARVSAVVDEGHVDRQRPAGTGR